MKNENTHASSPYNYIMYLECVQYIYLVLYYNLHIATLDTRSMVTLSSGGPY